MSTSKMNPGTYVVYSVESGDRLTLLLNTHKDKLGAFLPLTKGIIISNITVPKLGYGNAEQIDMTFDEPCAFDTFEFMRSQCIGKVVTFHPEYEIDVLNRTAGRISLPATNAGEEGEDAANALISKGLAKFNDRSQVNVGANRKADLMKLQERAIACNLGMFAKDAAKHVRPKMPFPPADIKKFAGDLKGKEVKVRVDRVQSPTALICQTLDTFQSFLLCLSGITIAKNDPKTLADAVFFVERMLLNRQIKVRFEGVDNLLSIMGSIVSPVGIFQVKLLSMGFYSVSNNTIVYVMSDTDRTAMFASERQVQERRGGAQKGTTDPPPVAGAPNDDDINRTPGDALAPHTAATDKSNAPLSAPCNFRGPRDFDAVLTQVISGDLIVVRPINPTLIDPAAAPEGSIRLSLAGVRASKCTREFGGGKNTSEARVTYSDYSWEAKELLRKRFVHKQVHVHIDYTRTIEETKEERIAATVYDIESNANLGATVIAAGYAKFFLGKNDASEAINLLIDAEVEAKSNQLGIHSNVTAPTVNIVELLRLGETKGKYYLSFLQRGMTAGGKPPVLTGIVEVVLNGGAFRVYIPKEHFQIYFKLAGVIAPAGPISMGATKQPADPFYIESKSFAVDCLQQKEVQIQVDASDRGGNFIGTLLLQGQNFAVMLAKEGLAVSSNPVRTIGGDQILQAESTAKSTKKGIWSCPDALPSRKMKEFHEQAFDDKPMKVPDHRVDKFTKISIIDVTGPCTLSIAYVSDSDKRRAVSEAVNGLSGTPAYVNPRPNEIVVAMYSEDKTWHRAKILKVLGSVDKASIHFIDYISNAEVNLKHIRKVPSEEEYKFVRELPPLASKVKIAMLRTLPSNQESFADAAIDNIWTYTEKDTHLYARHEYNIGNDKYMLISTSDNANQYTMTTTIETLSDYLLKNGVALIDNNVKDVVDPAGWKKANCMQAIAYKDHLGMWKYGDIGVDDEEEM